MVTWNANFEANPEDTDSANYGAAEIRTLKVAIRERLELEHNFQANTQPFHKPGQTSVVFVGNSTEIANLSNVANGCLAWDTALSTFKVYTAGAWVRRDPIPSGTKMLFVQSSAPSGWTIDSSKNDRLIRVVSANGGNIGGTWDLSANIGIALSGSHTHSTSNTSVAPGALSVVQSINWASTHNHSFTNANTWRPAYVDAIICTKD